MDKDTVNRGSPSTNNGRPIRLINIVRQRFNIPRFKNTPVLTDEPQNWRANVGGADPATPYAEAMINYHNHAFTYMIFVILTVIHCCRK
ncbi:hypothetical protein MACJ_003689 [Theileria orientalis]|uniref:Farnesyltransferase beta subunit n=1 Tax=Theileria orientalis TaxID=68886 RepID=A0A976SLJ7_THEOR|nr:hypothetical protein MACJ_003689 [Theileria orientalis]